MKELVIHDASRLMITMALSKLPHAILISGPEGVGVETVSRHIATQAAGDSKDIHHVVPDKGSIPIDDIRKLYELTRSKPAGRRVVVIHDADGMRHEAQNALLKLLEEPSQSTHFILTTHLPRILLPTIRSRVQEILLHPTSIQQTNQLLDTLTSDTAVKQKLTFVAAGLPAEIHRMHADAVYFEKRSKLVRDARTFLTSNGYDKLLIASEYANDRDMGVELLQVVGRLLMMTSKSTATESTIHLMMAVSDSIDWLKQNANVRLQLMSLALT